MPGTENYIYLDIKQDKNVIFMLPNLTSKRNATVIKIILKIVFHIIQKIAFLGYSK